MDLSGIGVIRTLQNKHTSLFGLTKKSHIISFTYLTNTGLPFNIKL